MCTWHSILLSLMRCKQDVLMKCWRAAMCIFYQVWKYIHMPFYSYQLNKHGSHIIFCHLEDVWTIKCVGYSMRMECVTFVDVTVGGLSKMSKIN